MRSHHRWRGIILSAALLVVLAGCASSGGESGGSEENVTIKEGGTLVYAADQEPPGFNTNTSADNAFAGGQIIQNIFAFTFHAYPDFTLHMDENLLESAELTSEDPQTIVYKIKDEAVWSDGTPVSADDFIYLWEHKNGTNEKFDVDGIAGYEDIESVTGSDGGKTVTVVFKKKFADWKGIFAEIVPSHYVESTEEGWNNGLDDNPEKIPSAGAFKVGSYQRGESLTLVPNDKYWGPAPHLDQIVFRFLPESQSQVQALQNGEVDLIYPQPQLDMVQQVESMANVQSEIGFGLIFEHLDFNFETPGLDDLSVRRAIAMALDKEEIVNRTVKQFSDKAQPLGNRIWLTGQPTYEDHSGPYGKGNTAEAIKLLEDAGYTKGSDGIYAKGDVKLSFRFTTTAGNMLRETQGLLLQDQMKKIGIEIKIANAPAAEYFGERLPAGNYDIANFAWVGGATPLSGTYDIYRCGGGSNYGKYCNEQVDALYSQAISELDEAEAKRLGNEIDKLLTEDMVTIPLYQKPTFIAWNTQFTNVKDNPTAQGPFLFAPQWAQKA